MSMGMGVFAHPPRKGGIDKLSKEFFKYFQSDSYSLTLL